MKIKRELLDELETLLNYCEGCFVAKQFKKERGRRYAHNFCIHTCTVGMEIKKIGQRLSGERIRDY